jgi:hypothetical protein
MKTFGELMAAEEAEPAARNAATRLSEELRARLAGLAPRTTPLARAGMVPVVLARINSIVRLANSYFAKGRAGGLGAWARAELLLGDAIRECDALEQALADAERAALDSSVVGMLRRASTGLHVEGQYPSVSAFLADLGTENALVMRPVLERSLGVEGEALAAWWSAPGRTTGEKLIAVDRAIFALAPKAER